MLLKEIIKQRENILALSNEYGARRIRVFGSVAREDDAADSDIDFLVDFPRGYDLFLQRIPLAEQLQGLLNRTVDLVPEHELTPYIRDRVLSEAIDLWKNPWQPYAQYILITIAKIHNIQKRGKIIDDEILYDAALRNLQTLSEATQRLTEEKTALCPDIPWKEISGFRNILVHNYLGNIDPITITKIIEEQLLPLESCIKTMLTGENER